MRRPFLSTALLALIGSAVFLAAASPARAEALTPGVRAPEFSLVGSDGRTHTLSQYRGKQGVVLAWFPKAFTPG